MKRKNKRYTVYVVSQRKTMDWAYVITDRRTDQETVIGGYATRASAWRGFANAQKHLYQPGVIEVIK